MDRKEEKNNPLYQKAELEISNHSLKEFNLVQYEKNLVFHLNCFDVLTRLHSSRQYGKQQFPFQQRKRRFQDRFINKAIKSFTEAAGGDDFIVAYGDGSFPLTMKAIDGGASGHKRLMMLLSKRVRIVMTNERCTTKGCPKCKVNSLSMKCPKGNRFSKNRKAYYHQHKASRYKSHDGFLSKTNSWAFTMQQL